MVEASATAKDGEYGRLRFYRTGLEIFQQGEQVDDVYLLHNGAVKLVWTSDDGREFIAGLRWDGWCLGAAARIAAVPSPVSATTLVRSNLERIPGETFDHLLITDREFAARILRLHSSEIVEQTKMLGGLACLSARKRFESFLASMIQSQGTRVCTDDGRLRLPLKRKEIAAHIGISPEHVSRIIAELCAERVIETKEQWICVRKPERLYGFDLRLLPALLQL